LLKPWPGLFFFVLNINSCIIKTTARSSHRFNGLGWKQIQARRYVMFQITPFPIRLIVVGSLMALVSSCAVTTRSTEGTSETLQNTTEASTKFTSSTSPRDEEKDGAARDVKQFATVNLDRLQEDMALGSGEHLTAFAHLLGIRESHQAEFFAVTKQNYPLLFGSGPTTSEDLLARLDTELAAYPAWRQ